MQQRTCPTCGGQFTPTANGQRFCPPSERDRTTNSQARSRCARRWDNARTRGKDPSVTALPLPGPFECAQCGKPCVPGEDGVSPQSTTFCGARCNRRWQHADEALLRLMVARSRECLRKIEGREAASWPPVGSEDDFRAVLAADPCSYCGALPHGRRKGRKDRQGFDHISPKADGGLDDVSNLTACCQRCNSAKGALPLLAALLWVPTSRRYHDLRRTLWAGWPAGGA